MSRSYLYSLLIAEDDRNLRETLSRELSERGFRVTIVDTLRQFKDLADASFDFALVDLRIGGENGLRFVQALAAANDRCKTVVLTGYGTIATAVMAMKLGAIDYLTKPASIDDILTAFAKGKERQALRDAIEDESRVPSLARKKREYIESILSECGGNITRAAKHLGVHRQSLQRKLRKFPPRD